MLNSKNSECALLMIVKIQNPTPSIQEIFSHTMATLVLYNTSLENSITFQSFSRALEKNQIIMDILLYDNSLIAQPIASSKQWNIQYVHDPTNAGVSKGYNSGFKLAKQKNKKWLWLLDQDTEYSGSTLDEYAQSVQQYPQQEIFIPQLHDSHGMVSPFRFKYGGGKRITLLPGIHDIHTFLFHNCGLLISLNTFERAGGYDEQFSLDFSDIAFISRLRKQSATFVLTLASGKHALAATSKATLQQRVIRFKSYMKAGQSFVKEYPPNDALVSIRFFFRCLKLCWEYKTFQFLRIYLNL